MDPGERGRDWRGVPLRIRDGRAGGLPGRGAHLANVEHVPRRPSVAAAILRSHPLLPGDRGGIVGDPGGVSVWAISAAHRGAAVPAARVSRVLAWDRAGSGG